MSEDEYHNRAALLAEVDRLRVELAAAQQLARQARSELSDCAAEARIDAQEEHAAENDRLWKLLRECREEAVMYSCNDDLLARIDSVLEGKE